MTVGRECRIRTRFNRRVAAGRGVGVDEAVAAAEARIESMREDACARIGEMIQAMQAERPALAGGDAEALARVQGGADALVGLCDLFGLPEIGKAALSLCQLVEACRPLAPASSGVLVHLDALAMFWSADPGARAAAAPKVLDGLRQIAHAARTAAI